MVKATAASVVSVLSLDRDILLWIDVKVRRASLKCFIDDKAPPRTMLWNILLQHIVLGFNRLIIFPPPQIVDTTI